MPIDDCKSQICNRQSAIGNSSLRVGPTSCRRRSIGNAFVAVCGLCLPLVILHTAHAALAEDRTAETLYDGRTLGEWRERIKRMRYDGPEAAEAVPGLLEIAEDRDAPWFSRRQAALTLGRIGEPARGAVPVLVGLLNESSCDPDEDTRLWAIKALARFGPVAAEAAPALVDLLEDETQPLLPRLATLEALGRIGPGEPVVLPAILRILDNSGATDAAAAAADLELQIAATEMLELFGGHASAAIPALIRHAASRELRLRGASVLTLGAIGPAADPAIPTLADALLFDEAATVRDLAAVALGRIGAAAEPVLSQLLSDREPDVRRRAAMAFAQMSTATSTTVEQLQEGVTDSDPGVRVAMLRALWSVTRNADRVLPGALAALTEEDRELRMQAALLLESLDEPGRASAIPKLEALRTDARPYVRQAAQRVLRTIQPRRGF